MACELQYAQQLQQPCPSQSATAETRVEWPYTPSNASSSTLRCRFTSVWSVAIPHVRLATAVGLCEVRRQRHRAGSAVVHAVRAIAQTNRGTKRIGKVHCVQYIHISDHVAQSAPRSKSSGQA